MKPVGQGGWLWRVEKAGLLVFRKQSMDFEREAREADRRAVSISFSHTQFFL